jgi:cell fate (sporulation/competence/biofilm development) regulator YlbF (YheA/YmcA/DUF963 family)
MPITEEIRQAAENLGKQLGANPNVQDLISKKNKVQQDARVVELEDRLALLNQKLAEREQTGGRLDRTVVEEYYELKDLVNENPLIIARDYQKEIVNALFVQVVQRMTPILGIEYTTFVL